MDKLGSNCSNEEPHQNWKIFFSKTTEPISTKLGTKHPWVKGIQISSKKGPRPFPRGDNYEIAKIHLWNLKIFYRTTGPISTKLGTMHPWVKEIQVYSNEEPCPFPRGDNYEKAKIHWWNLKIFFYRTTGLISTKLGTKHPWVKGIQVCSNEGNHPFPRGDNYEKAKTLGTKHPWVKGIQICTNKGPHPFPRGDNYEIAKITLVKLKSPLLLNHWANFNQTWHKASLNKGDLSLFNKEPMNCHNVNNVFFFSYSTLWYYHMCLLIWTVFSGERCGPWNSCFYDGIVGKAFTLNVEVRVSKSRFRKD